MRDSRDAVSERLVVGLETDSVGGDNAHSSDDYTPIHSDTPMPEMVAEHTIIPSAVLISAWDRSLPRL